MELDVKKMSPKDSMAMDSYRKNILKDYYYSKKGYYNSGEETDFFELHRFLLKRREQMELYWETLLARPERKAINCSQSIEMNKGFFDSLTTISNLSAITPYTKSFDDSSDVQKYDRLTYGVLSRTILSPVMFTPYVEKSSIYCPVREDISFVLSQNPYNNSDFETARNLFDDGSADIIAGIYGDVTDKDYEIKRDALLRTFENRDNVKFREKIIGSTYICYVIGYDKENNQRRRAQ